MKHVISMATIALTVALASSAWAAVCVEVDEERDNLQPAERAAVRTMVEDALRAQKLDVSRTNCATTYTIYSLRLGNSVTAHISGPEGSKSQKAQNIEELPETYGQLARALVGAEDGQMAGVDRTNVTRKQAAPRRVSADSLWFLRLGYGAIVGGNFASGPAFGLGYRYELDQFGIEISGLNFLLATDGADDLDAGLTGSWIRLGGIYFFDPVANHSPYANLGLSWGGTAVTADFNNTRYAYTGSGLQGEIGVGYEFLRASTIRLFIEANAVLPFYTATIASFDDKKDSIYTPSFTLSLGLGYDSSPSRIVEVY